MIDYASLPKTDSDCGSCPLKHECEGDSKTCPMLVNWEHVLAGKDERIEKLESILRRTLDPLNTTMAGVELVPEIEDILG